LFVDLVWLNKQDSNSKESTKKKGGKRERTSKEVDEEEPKGYIHVRARRGQATDSHSLAERVLCTIACKIFSILFVDLWLCVA
jgi:hypothetical protein